MCIAESQPEEGERMLYVGFGKCSETLKCFPQDLMQSKMTQLKFVLEVSNEDPGIAD